MPTCSSDLLICTLARYPTLEEHGYQTINVTEGMMHLAYSKDLMNICKISNLRTYGYQTINATEGMMQLAYSKDLIAVLYKPAKELSNSNTKTKLLCLISSWQH
jgi:hypothetical protein